MTKEYAWIAGFLVTLLTLAGTIFRYGQEMGVQSAQIMVLKEEVSLLRTDMQEVNRYILTWMAQHQEP